MTSMTAEQLSQFATTDYYDSKLSDTDDNQGYQRPLLDRRSRDIIKYMQDAQEVDDKIIMPMPILCSARGQDMRLDRGKLVINSEHKLYIIDGQHRTEAYRNAFEQESFEGSDKIQYPIIILLEITKLEEMLQFNVINSTQKGVDTGLNAKILSMFHANSGALNAKDQSKAVYADIATRLNSDQQTPWFRKIAMPDQRGLGVSQITNFRTMTNSIKQIDAVFYDKAFDTDKSVEDRSNCSYKVVSAAWKALAQIPELREVFANPKMYSLQQSGGLTTIHLIIAQLLRHHIRNNERGVIRTWRSLFERSQSLRDPAFWHRGTEEEGLPVIPRGRGAMPLGAKAFASTATLILLQIKAEQYYAMLDASPQMESEPDIETPFGKKALSAAR